jgi:hypothetical protein
MGDYEKYEAACKQIRKANESLLDEFKASLQSAGLSQRTIKNHVDNVGFYINEFLLYEDAVEAKEGVHNVSMFLGYWFIRKALWASSSSIKSSATSIKKFYSLLVEKGLVDHADFEMLGETIKEGMPEWLEAVSRFDSVSTME